MKNFGKYFLLVLAFLSIGGVTSYGNTLPDIKEDHPFSSQDIKASGSIMWASRENPFQKISDLSENLYFENFSVIPGGLILHVEQPTATLYLDYERDLRHILSQQIFPKHFFL